MDESVEITEPEQHSTGDFLAFSVIAGGRRIPAKLVGTAIQILANKTGCAPELAFTKNREQIKDAVRRKLHLDPKANEIVLRSHDF
jgi:hypothetical protein